MDDVHTRFILNLPDDELRSAPRIFFQLEQAWWFYDDFICDGAAADANANTATAPPTKGEDYDSLPRYKHVKPFSYAMFQFSPLLQPMLPDFETMYDEFANYKRSISTYGTILLNEEATKVALVRPWQSKSWTFPGGKVNQNESGYDAACRETYEETGFDPMVEPPSARTNSRSTSSTSSSSLREQSKLSYTERDSNKKRTCYICRGVPMDFPFEPIARKEVSEIKWFDISTLPKQKTYAVLPFYSQLREWIKRDNRARRISVDSSSSLGASKRREEQEEEDGHNSSRGRRRRSGDDDDDDDKVDDDDGGLAPFFSEDGKAPWEQDEEGEGAVATMNDKKDNVVVNSSNKGSSGNSVVGDGPLLKGPNNHEKQQQQQRNSGSIGKQKLQNSRSTPPPRAGSTSSSRGGSTGRDRRRGGCGEETTCAKTSTDAVVSASDPLVKSALATPGESGRWTEDEMFAANEKLSGRKITYDGNPHEFAAGGWGSGIVRDGNRDNAEGGGRAAIVDPHAFHVVGGSFMNSEACASGTAASSLTAPPPEASKLQPLVNARTMTPGSMVDGGGEGDDGLGLTPFFSNDGRAPWEEEENNTCVRGTNIRASKDPTPQSVSVQGPPPGRYNSKGLALLNRLRQGGCANDDEAKEERGGTEQIHVAMMADMKETNIDEWFMTDREITAKSQSKKLSLLSRAPEHGRAPWEEENSTCVRETNISASKESTPQSVSAQGPPPGRKYSKGMAPLNRLRQGGCANDDEAKEERRGAEQIHVAMMADMKDTNDIDEWFMTDREITAKSQSKKLSLLSRAPEPVLVPAHERIAHTVSSPHVSYQWIEDEVSPHIINEHLVWMKNWAQQLPKAGPTKVFGDFRLDIDSILNVATVAHKGSN